MLVCMVWLWRDNVVVLTLLLLPFKNHLPNKMLKPRSHLFVYFISLITGSSSYWYFLQKG